MSSPKYIFLWKFIYQINDWKYIIMVGNIIPVGNSIRLFIVQDITSPLGLIPWLTILKGYIVMKILIPISI